MNETTLQDLYPHLPFKRNWEVTGELSYLLGECVAYVRVLRETPLLPNEHGRLLLVSLRKGALATTAIEGNTLSEKDLELILDKNQNLPESKQYLQTEVENIIDAMNKIKEDLMAGNDSLIDSDLICKFHRLITKNLGEYADCVPGQFREDNRTVGGYRAPDYQYVSQLMRQLSDWLKSEFHYPKYESDYGPIIHAIVAHIYLEWIHPFADGNGRTGRLLEFYILVRGRVPVVASTLLSNHYNETRTEYYRHFDHARKRRDLSDFLLYAVRGLRDGLRDSLRIAQESVLTITWQHLVYNKFRAAKGSKSVVDRRRELALAMQPNVQYKKEDVLFMTPRLSKYYATRDRLGSRDLNELESMGLIINLSGEYQLNTSELWASRLPETRSKSSAGPEQKPL